MIKIIITFIVGVLIGLCVDSLFNKQFPDKFYDVRLFEIIQLTVTILVGGSIAYYFSKQLNKLGKRSEITYAHITSIIEAYEESINIILNFMSDPSSTPKKEITLFFKNLSSKIYTIEKRTKIMGLDGNKVSGLSDAHDKLNELVVGDSWGMDPSKIIYSENQRQEANKEYSIIETYLQDLRFSLYE